MGLIKTAMVGGAALYSVNKIAQTVQTRNSNSPSHRHECSRCDHNANSPRPVEFRDPSPQNQGYVNTRDLQDHEGMYANEPRQRLYLESQRPGERESYYHQHNPQYEQASNMRAQPGARGFVQPNEIMNDGFAAGGGSGMDVVTMLAQQAMNMGLVAGNKGKEGKGSKTDMLAGLFG